MWREYHRDGLSFRFQSGWELSEDEADLQRTITLQTTGASFWTLTVFADRPDPDRILASVLEAFREDYEDLDVYPVTATVLGQPAAGVDLDFVYLDLVNSVVIRAFQTDEVSVLVMYQGPYYELEEIRADFDTVTESLVFEDHQSDA